MDLVLHVQGMDHVVVEDRIVIHDVKIRIIHRVMLLLLLILVGVM
jgi:hypothetical protein